ncbi:PAS domain-containing sensor histidine kinase [Hydrogenophaga sp. PAMC20947]|uniref:hybrid sensor histidine kinase/response regulator n=1 Tax=Hydrogenophaga sp. PAMC20947 TaxID=2565558 RepID=UPI00109E33B9|nr:PAS domain-containing sensor histidine kinase [Hydrogenophaga sp. PAMC20947]QCB44768.1 PAS domain-containing sensor histidine kinase [Hydrogenophaga sp. PAMC20947]
MPFNPSDPPLPADHGEPLGASHDGGQVTMQGELLQRPRDDKATRIKALAFEAVSEGVVITDAAQRILLANPAFESITGYGLPEIMGRTCALLQGPLTDVNTVHEMRQALHQRLAFSGQIFNYRKDGSTYWNDLSISPLRDDQGNVTHFIGLMRDISLRKRAEAALQEGEVRYRSATEAAGGHILDIDTRFRYTFVSERAEQLLGYPAKEMLGRTPAEFMPPGELEKVNAWLESHLQQDGAIHGLEHRVVTKSGSTLWLQISRIPLQDNQGVTIGYRGIAFDITARKQAEQADIERETHIRESQKMEAIGTLAGGIAHDFNNIIAAILGNVSLARQDLNPASPALQSLNEIDKAATRARDLVRQILSFSRRQNSDYKRTSLSPIVDDTARMLRAMLPARVAIEVNGLDGTPEVLGDTSQLQQVIINLATNAMQAMGGQSGQIRIGLDATAPDEHALAKHPALRALVQQHPDGLVRLTVADDGPGMDEATLGRIFEPFFTTKPVGEGTGLGLAVVHGIAQGHKGLVLVESQPGAGTQFALYLPASPSPVDQPLETPTTQPKNPATSSPTTPPDAAGSAVKPGPHIVYVDDDDSLILLIKRLLERRGYRVSAFLDQQSALSAIRNDPAGIDLMLTDYNMPGMSGLDLAREALLIRPDLLCVITSGFIDEKLSTEAASAGVHKLILKAIAVDEFCAAIEALVPANA